MKNTIEIKGTAETAAPTAVADGEDVKPWLDEYGRKVVVIQDTSGNELGVNKEFTLLASGARTAETASASQANLYHKGMILFVDVTADPAAASIDPTIVMTPSIGTAKTIWTATASIEATGQYAYVFYPSAEDAGSYTEQQEMVIPPDWKFTMEVADTASMTYSVTGCYIVQENK